VSSSFLRYASSNLARRSLLCLALFALPVACTKKSSPSDPTPTPAPAPAATRIIRLGGNLNFGGVPFFTVRDDGILTVSNDGNANLQVEGISFVTTLSNSAAAPNLRQWCFDMFQPLRGVVFAVAPGDPAFLGFRFAPVPDPARGMIPRPPDFRFDCSGTLTVRGDQTSGTNTISVTIIATS